MMDICSIFLHHSQGSQILKLCMKVNFLLWHNISGLLQHHAQALGSKPSPPAVLPDAVSDMSPAIAKSLTQPVPQVKLPYDLIILPQEVGSGGNVPLRQANALSVIYHLRESLREKFTLRHSKTSWGIWVRKVNSSSRSSQLASFR